MNEYITAEKNMGEQGEAFYAAFAGGNMGAPGRLNRFRQAFYLLVGSFAIFMRALEELVDPEISIPDLLRFKYLSKLIPYGDDALLDQLGTYLTSLEKILGFEPLLYNTMITHLSAKAGLHRDPEGFLRVDQLSSEEKPIEISRAFDLVAAIEKPEGYDTRRFYNDFLVSYLICFVEKSDYGRYNIDMPLSPELAYFVDRVCSTAYKDTAYGISEDSFPFLFGACPGAKIMLPKNRALENRDMQTVMRMLCLINNNKGVEFIERYHECVAVQPEKLSGKCSLVYAFVPEKKSIDDIYEGNSEELISNNLAWWREPLDNGQYLYLRHAIKAMSENGMAVLFMSVGLLSRLGSEQKIRKYIIEENLLDAVIEFPFQAINRPNYYAAMLVLKKGRISDKVRMLKLVGEKGQEFFRERSNRFSATRLKNPDSLFKLLESNEEIPGLAKNVSAVELMMMNYCFNPGAYMIDGSSKGSVDLKELEDKRKILAAKLIKVDNEFEEDFKDLMHMLGKE